MMIRLLQAVVAVVLGAVIPGAPTISLTAAVDMTCVGAQHATYTPGLTLQTQPTSVHVENVYKPCTSSGAPAITSGGWSSSFPRALSCVTLVQSNHTGPRVITWNTGETSTVEYHNVVNRVGDNTVIVLVGRVTAGRFAGDTATESVVVLNVNVLSCLSPQGITSGTGLVTLTFTRP